MAYDNNWLFQSNLHKKKCIIMGKEVSKHFLSINSSYFNKM